MVSSYFITRRWFYEWNKNQGVIADGNVQNLLDIINDVIVDNILGNSDEPDEEGVRLQRIYDEIYN